MSQTAAMLESGHDLAAAPKRGRIHCCVCNLEKQFRMAANRRGLGEKMKTSYSMANIVGCAKDGCSLHAHSVPVCTEGQFIFNRPEFYQMTCFQIAHHESTKGLWLSNPKFRYKPEGRDTRKSDEKKAFAVLTSHPLYIQLRSKYGLNSKKRKVVAMDENENDSDENDDIEDDEGEEYEEAPEAEGV